jgi:hypothetical protein
MHMAIIEKQGHQVLHSEQQSAQHTAVFNVPHTMHNSETFGGPDPAFRSPSVGRRVFTAFEKDKACMMKGCGAISEKKTNPRTATGRIRKYAGVTVDGHHHLSFRTSSSS